MNTENKERDPLDLIREAYDAAGLTEKDGSQTDEPDAATESVDDLPLFEKLRRGFEQLGFKGESGRR
ncbi:MAG: hypothetical protein ACQEXQ_07625 [Bacillota bacterium]